MLHLDVLILEKKVCQRYRGGQLPIFTSVYAKKYKEYIFPLNYRKYTYFWKDLNFHEDTLNLEKCMF